MRRKSLSKQCLLKAERSNAHANVQHLQANVIASHCCKENACTLLKYAVHAFGHVTPPNCVLLNGLQAAAMAPLLIASCFLHLDIRSAGAVPGTLFCVATGWPFHCGAFQQVLNTTFSLKLLLLYDLSILVLLSKMCK